MLQSNKKKTVLFIIVFIIICIAITGIAIFLTNEGIISLPKKQITQRHETENDNSFGIKSLEDKFSFNPITITIKSYHSGKKIQTKELEDFYPIEIDYLQINGLKDTIIQKKINEKIKNAAFAQIDNNEIKEKKLKNVTILTEVTGNFSNVLSIRFEKTYRESDYTWNSSDSFITLNFNLKTGEQISFTDLFTADAGTKNIIAKSAYNSFAEEYIDKIYFLEEEEEWNWDGDMSKIDYSEIEDRVFKVLQNYDRRKQYPFYFTERYICVKIQNEQIFIPMREFYNQIAIYNRYAQNNIFEKEKTNQSFVFTLDSTDDTVYRRVEKISDNLFVDIDLRDWSSDDYKNNVKNKLYIQNAEKQIEDCKKYLNNNKNKAIVLAIWDEIYNDEQEETHNYYLGKATMNKQYFESTFFNKALEWEQTDHFSGDAMGPHLISFLMGEEKNKNIKLEIEYPK